MDNIIFLRAKIYKYNKDDKKVFLNPKKDYYVMELKDVLYQYYRDQHNTEEKDKHYGLAEYIDKREPLYKQVKMIDYFVDDTYLIFKIVGSIEDTDCVVMNNLKEYIKGQISDGAWENGIYLLEGFIGNKVKHYWVDTELEQVIMHPFEHKAGGIGELFIPGNSKTIKEIYDKKLKEIKNYE